jgi:hypothetical protein
MAIPPRLQRRSKRQEIEFLSEYCRFEANVEFHRARLKSLMRRIAALIARRKNGTSEWETIFRAAGNVRDVPIDSIVGMINSKGRPRSHLPLMSRRLAAAWKIGFCADSSEPGPIEAVRTQTGEWYLSGGSTSLLRLELLRAKGFRVVPLVLSAAHHAPDGTFVPKDESVRSGERACIAC